MAARLKWKSRGRASKYGNIRRIYNGVSYASIAEANHAMQLDLLQCSGHIRFWIGQPKFRLGCPENVYIADFLVIQHDGGAIAQDVKGRRTAKFQHDVKLWAHYGPCPLEIWSKGVCQETITPAPHPPEESSLR